MGFRRHSIRFGIVLFSLAAILAGSPATGQAQVAGPREANGKLPRPIAKPVIQVAVLPNELLVVLQNWHNATKDIKKLEGTHTRIVYDSVFQVEKRAVGKFYYQAPDKGRMDLEAVDIKPGTVNPKMRGKKDKKPYRVESDRPERWISDGKNIRQIDDFLKTFADFPLPKNLQGKNIMDGPLPFLFGMPPQKARQRFQISLLLPLEETAPKNSKSPTVWLKVIPRKAPDKANYSEAHVILDGKTYLPTAVKLIAPAGTQETVYSFRVKEPGLIAGLLGRNPFNPKLIGYKKVQRNPQANAPGAAKIKQVAGNKPAPIPAGMTTTPSVIGLGWKTAQEKLQKLGFKVKLTAGKSTTNTNYQFRVYAQIPEPTKPIKPGAEINLGIYVKPEAASKAAPRQK